MADDNYKMVVVWSLPNGSQGQNVIYANVPGGDSAVVGDLITDLAGRVGAIFGQWLAHVTASCILELVKIYAFNAATGISTPLGSGVLNDPGTSVNGPLPAGCAVKMNVYPTAKPRPAGNYLPAPTTGSLDSDGSLDAATVAGALAVATALTAGAVLPLTSLSYNPVYWVKADGVIYSYELDPVSVNDVMDYQRRRKAGVGI